MEQAEITMLENLKSNTGKSLEEWVAIARKEQLTKHGQIVKFLKENHDFTHGFANLVAHKTLKSDAGSVENKDDLVTDQYAGKEHLKPIYDSLMATIESFGKDIEIAPKKAYVSLRRKKQFAILQPATKTRFEVQLILKGHKGEGKLEEIPTANAMCTHKVKLQSMEDIDETLIGWIKKAYEQAG